uniref:uncharacterized protein LOC122595371 n=1 Tax=Erigeron canadensis TaxID=72917 RepID=UPI001CB966FE|nr:uncharacterized protein LOC122595371 [Erigeron canadensis]
MSKRTKKSKQPKEPATNSSNWTELEMKVLTECWIDATEDPYVGKDQSVDSFWGKIIDKYNARFPNNSINHNQISGKWRKIRTNVSKFNAIWKGYDGYRYSGENDAQVMEEARSEYFTQTKTQFTMYECWLLVKDKPKFFAPSGYLYAPPTKSKASRTSASSDAGSARSSASDLAARLDRLGCKKEAVLNEQQMSLAAIREEERKRTMYTALSFMDKTKCDDEEKNYIKEAKKKLMADYKDFLFSPN